MMHITNLSNRLTTNKPFRYVVIGLLFLLTFYGLYSSFIRGAANAWYFSSEFSINHWAKQNKISDEADYITTLAAITKAQKLDPSHPHYAHMLGRVIHWGVDSGYEEKSRLTEVMKWYKLSSELRPLWPDVWIDLARLNNYLYGYDQRTKNYIHQALKTGPYVDPVTIGTIQIWLLNWSKLTGQERAALFKQFDVATKNYAVLSQVLSFAQRINKEKLLCSQLKYKPQYAKRKDSWLYKKHCS